MKTKTNIITRAEAKRLCPHKAEKCHGRNVMAEGPNGEDVGYACEPCIMDALKAETDLFKLRFKYIERIIWEFGHNEFDLLIESTPETYLRYVKGANNLAKNAAGLIAVALTETDCKLLEREVERIGRKIKENVCKSRKEVAHA